MLAGRVAIITGAGKGLGRAYALAFARAGAAVIVNNRRHPGEADAATSAAQVVAAIRSAGGRAEANYEPVEHPASGERMVAQARASFGRLDIVVANAALAQHTSFHHLSIDAFRRIFDIGFLGTLHLLHAAWPIFREQRYGRAVVTSSSAGRFGGHGLSAYSASKGAIEMLMRSLAAEGAARGIKVNAISPFARSQMTEAHLAPELAARLAPEAVAPMVTWLASEACTASGEVIVGAGGRFRRGLAVETASVAPADGEIGTAVTRLAALPGVPYPDSHAAFLALVAELEGRE